MKRLLIILTVFMLTITFSSCDRVSPRSYVDSKWVSKNPDGYFIINTQLGEVENHGEFFLEDKTVEFFMRFGGTNSMAFLDSDGNRVLFGFCKFYESKIIMEVEEWSDKLFVGRYKEIVFLKEEDLI